MQYRRPALAFVLGAIALTAALGLYAVIVPDFGDTQAKILGTSAAISGASILILACLPAWERRLAWPVPPVGALAALLGLVLGVVGLWAEPSSETYGKVLVTVVFLAVWSAFVSVLALVPLVPRFRWAFFTAAAVTLCLTVIGSVATWASPQSEAFGRVAGAVAVLAAASVVTVPVLSRAARLEPEPSLGFCPRCGRCVEQEGACAGCGARFSVTYES